MDDISTDTANQKFLDKKWQKLINNQIEADSQEIANISKFLGELLMRRGELITTAESCTGGMLASGIVDIAGSSKYFHTGLVTYGNDSKRNYLAVSQRDLQQFGAVSEQVVTAMVNGALNNEKTADLAIAISGVAGPQGGSEINPVGSVWLAVKHNQAPIFTHKLQFKGDRLQVRKKTTLVALIKACLMLLLLP